MKVSQSQFVKPTFKGATISINVLSDTHGEIYLANSAVEEVRRLSDDLFCKEEKGSANIIAVCGDWFMDGGKKGYLSAPEKLLAMFQLDILNEFLRQIKGFAPNSKAIFTPGNHEFDGGVRLLDDILSRIDADILISNLDIKNSSGFSKSIHGNKIFNEKIIEVDDDKNPDLKHKALFLGVIPVNLKMYQRNLDGISLIDLNDKRLASVNKEDYQNTLDECKRRIDKFRQENPNGTVVFLGHVGADFSDNLAQESKVDVIFDGHEHKTKMRIVNDTPIIPLSQNFLKMANAKIKIDDTGEKKEIKLFDFNPSLNRAKGPLYYLYKRLLEKDIEKKYSIHSDNPNIRTLDVKGVRSGNSFLANFVTDAVLSELKRKDPSIDIFAINASAIRHTLQLGDNPSVSNFDILNVLAGIKEDDAQIIISDVSGEQLVELVIDSVMFSKNNPEKNPVIHYSGLIIHRNKIMEAVQDGKPLSEIAQYVISSDTNKAVNLSQTYRIANPEKYFNKTKNPSIKALKEKSTFFGVTVQEMFKGYFENNKDNIHAKCDVRIK